ncbi:MAG: tRNA-dihydrouridine synthase [Verrucomicrobia bacterium]|nr:tRNA-dihydrouridine synthase [Verrucomicrobiota bacterium]
MLKGPAPILALAPMQDVTDLPFWRLMAHYGGADVYFTEFFRVHAVSRLDKYILKSITDNPTGRPVVAQMVGNDIPSLVRTAKELQRHPIAAVDLNLGCPAPVVYRKCAGGGLLRDLARLDGILGALREAVTVPLTVKTRLGFEAVAEFDGILRMFQRHALDLVVVHGRTVKETFHHPVHYDCVAEAVRALGCPVVANGDIFSSGQAQAVLKRTRTRGVMLGRGAIRNPWIFRQIRETQHGEAVFVPTGRDVLEYVKRLYHEVYPEDLVERKQVEKMKLYMIHLAPGADPSGRFLHDIRRVGTEVEFFRVCQNFLDHGDPMPLAG